MINPFKLARKLKECCLQIGRINQEVNTSKFYLRRMYLEDKILNCNNEGITKELYGENEIIVSLTTYGRRIYDVCLTIESLMQQITKANKIVLWLDREEKNKPLPETIMRQIKRGLTVRYTKDIRSYTKLIPALKSYPEAAIITVDDDIIYDFDILDRIIKAYLSDPLSIHACRMHTMKFENGKKLKPYEQWDWNSAKSSSRSFITGVGGVLYPPTSLSEEIFNEDVFTSICPTADDVWFTAMAKLKGTLIKKVPTRSVRGEDYVENEGVQDMGLHNINVGINGHNNDQVHAVFSKYKIYDLIH